MNKPIKFNRRSIIAGFFGNILEWYDFAVYGYFATVIGDLFFPSEDKISSLIAVFGVFAAGYLVRPLGGVIFGHIGDKYGRKKALYLSIILMAIPTTLVGFLPTHEHIGYWAAILLVLLRLMQGLSIGGELTGSVSFLTEMAPEGKRGYYGSWAFVGVFIGILLGSALGALITKVLSTDQVHAYGWRIPFLSGFLVGAIGLYFRKNMLENKLFDELKNRGKLSKTPIKDFWKDYKKPAVLLFFFIWNIAVTFYIVFLFLPSFLHTFLSVDLHIALTANTIAMVVLILLLPFTGKLSDRIGRKPVMLIAQCGFIILIIPLFWILFKGTFAAILGALIGFAILHSMNGGALSAMMAEMFPTKIRYTGISISYNLPSGIFGGTAPLIATWLIKITGGNLWMPAIYFLFSAIVALVAIFYFKDKYREPLQ